MNEPRRIGRPAKRPQTIARQEFTSVLREARSRYGKFTDSDRHLLYVVSGGDRSVEKEIFRSYKPNTPHKLVLDMEFPGRTDRSLEVLQAEYEEHQRSVSRKRMSGQRDKRKDAVSRADVILDSITTILNRLKPSGPLSVSSAAALAKTHLDRLGLDCPTPSERTLRRIITVHKHANLATQGQKKST
jgi:hypothetical protein